MGKYKDTYREDMAFVKNWLSDLKKLADDLERRVAALEKIAKPLPWKIGDYPPVVNPEPWRTPYTPWYTPIWSVTTEGVVVSST